MCRNLLAPGGCCQSQAVLSGGRRTGAGLFLPPEVPLSACLAAGVQTKAHILEDSVAEELRDRLSKPPFDGHLYGRDPEIAARFYVGAMLSVIRWWLTESHPLPQEELLRNVARLLPEFSGE